MPHKLILTLLSIFLSVSVAAQAPAKKKPSISETVEFLREIVESDPEAISHSKSSEKIFKDTGEISNFLYEVDLSKISNIFITPNYSNTLFVVNVACRGLCVLNKRDNTKHDVSSSVGTPASHGFKYEENAKRYANALQHLILLKGGKTSPF